MTPGAVVELRDAGPEDVAAVAAAERALFGTEAWSTSVVVDALAGGTRTVVVAEVGNVLAGYAVVSVVGEVADLERIAVLPERRRAGLATALLDAVRTRAHLRGAQRLLLEVAEANEGARALYAAHGSVELDRRRRYYRDGSDALVLRLPVAATGSAREEEGNGG